MTTKDLKKLLAVAGLVLYASTVIAQEPPVTTSVQPAAVGTPIPQPFIADQAGLQPKTTNEPAFDIVTKMFRSSPLTSKNADENLTPVEGLDSRAWTTVVGSDKSHSGFPTGEIHQLKLHYSWAF